jgi:hypothetical protein
MTEVWPWGTLPQGRSWGSHDLVWTRPNRYLDLRRSGHTGSDLSAWLPLLSVADPWSPMVRGPARPRKGTAYHPMRPLPCQIQRACAGMKVERLKTGEDYRIATGDRRFECSSAPTILHGAPRVVLVHTAVGCCPSAAHTHQVQPLGGRSESPACINSAV